MHITSFPTRKVNDMLTSGVNISLTGAGCRYAVLVASKNLVRRITAALGALDVADGPMSQLDAARRLREAAEELETAQVEAARKAGATWNEIGACYGLTKQGAQQRFRAARNQAKAGVAPRERKRADPTERTRGGET
jgi:molybdenum cofactor biosynthesis enzyme